MARVLRQEGPLAFAAGPQADPGPAQVGKETDFHAVF
jgi:hypothetical protein